MQEQNEMQDQNTQQQVPVPPATPQNNGMSEEEKRADNFRIRLSKARQEAEEEAKRADKLAKELNELKKKFDSGKATTNEAAEYVSTENKVVQTHQEGIHPDEIPGIIQEHMATEKLHQKLSEATSKDPQLKALMEDPSSLQKISKEELGAMKYLDNAPAVFKHLLTNDNDRMVLKAAEQAYVNGDGGTAFYTFLNNLSEKLKSTAKYPHPSSYKEIPDLSDVGEGESFDISDYIAKKYKR